MVRFYGPPGKMPPNYRRSVQGRPVFGHYVPATNMHWPVGALKRETDCWLDWFVAIKFRFRYKQAIRVLIMNTN